MAFRSIVTNKRGQAPSLSSCCPALQLRLCKLAHDQDKFDNDLWSTKGTLVVGGKGICF